MAVAVAFGCVLLGVGDGELVVGVGAGLVVSPASDAVEVAPPLPLPGEWLVSKTAATATMTTAAATMNSQRHRRSPDCRLPGGIAGGPPTVGGPSSNGPETGTRDVSGRKPCSALVAAIEAAGTADPRAVGS